MMTRKLVGVFTTPILLAAAWGLGPIAALAGPGPLVSTGDMGTQRSEHTATLLGDGSVLVAGGAYCLYIWDGGGCQTDMSLASAEIFHPDGTWTNTGSMAVSRFLQTATRLSNGKVLVAGGHFEPAPYSTDSPVDLAEAELYDPATGTWSTTGSMSQARGDALATLLADGSVLVAGGTAGSSAELYHPDTGTWSTTGSMAQAHGNGTMTRLLSGKVLVVGGYPAAGTAAASELYDPASGTWAIAGVMVAPRGYHSATLLADGTVLVAGGLDSAGAVALNAAEIFQPSTNSWSPTARTQNNHAFQNANSVLLPDGTALLADEGAEVYDPVARSWAFVPGTNAWYGESATLLSDGRVLIAGGCCVPTTYLSSAQLYGAPQPDPPLTATGTNLVSVEGAQLAGLVASFSDADPSGIAAQYTTTIYWADGTASPGSISNATSGFNVSGTHVYAEEGTYAVKVSILDSGGAMTTATDSIGVGDAALIMAGTGSALTARAQIATTLALAYLTDADPGGSPGDYAVTVEWGDGSKSSSTATASGTGIFAIAGTHTYQRKGNFTITVSASDVGGYAATPLRLPIRVSS